MMGEDERRIVPKARMVHRGKQGKDEEVLWGKEEGGGPGKTVLTAASRVVAETKLNQRPGTFPESSHPIEVGRKIFPGPPPPSTASWRMDDEFEGKTTRKRAEALEERTEEWETRRKEGRFVGSPQEGPWGSSPDSPCPPPIRRGTA